MSYIVVKIKEKISYSDGLELQHKVYDFVSNNVYDGVLLILEHKHVLSMGIRSNFDNLLVSKELLKEKNVEFYETDRGGDITYHGPGQIVAYPIFKLKELKLRLSDYMHNLEKVVIDTLSTHNLKAYQRDDYPGVWIDNTKICAIGVRARKYITYHGLAYNVTTDKSYFNLINPCGITDFRVSSLEDFIDETDIEKEKNQIIKSFTNIFGHGFQEVSLNELFETSKKV